VLRQEERLQRKPGGLALSTENGTIRVGKDAVIIADTAGRLQLGAGGVSGALEVLGRLEAPAGSIELSGASVAVGADAQLLARGVASIHADKSGHLQGEVRAGGVIDIRGAEVTLAAGSLLDVSGAMGRSEQAEAGNALGQLGYAKRGLASDGGSIRVRGAGLMAGTLAGQAGGAGAQGGTLAIAHATAVTGANLAERVRGYFAWPPVYVAPIKSSALILPRWWTRVCLPWSSARSCTSIWARRPGLPLP